jgi:hypothetical protein
MVETNAFNDACMDIGEGLTETIPSEILFHSHLTDLCAAFRRGEWIENRLFPSDHTPALAYKQRSKSEPHSEYWIELEKAVAVVKAVTKCRLPIAHIASLNKHSWEFESSDTGWNKLTERQRRRHSKRAHEGIGLAAATVGAQSGNKHCSLAAKERRGQQLQSQDEYLKTQVAINSKTGKFFRLASTGEKRKTRLAEMFTITKGIEKLIASNNLHWSACVVTAPANMHPNPLIGKNSWDGTLPHEVTNWLSNGWKQIRARLAKFGITLSGGWFRESNQDSTPHVNFFLVFNAGDYRQIARAFKEVFGHSKKAVKMMLGADPRAVAALAKKGKKPRSFASYAMKYFMKGFNGWGIDDDADREETTASAFGYRRHGFFGLPPLSTWRELRRLKSCPKNSSILAGAWHAAHRGDAATWIMLSGGLACKRNSRPIQPLRVDVEGCKQKQVIGLIAKGTGLNNDIHIKTRTPKSWSIEPINSQPLNIKAQLREKVTLKVNHPSKTEMSKLETDFEKLPIIFTPNTKITTEKEVEKHKEEQKYIQIEAKLWQERRRITLNSHYLH